MLRTESKQIAGWPHVDIFDDDKLVCGGKEYWSAWKEIVRNRFLIIVKIRIIRNGVIEELPTCKNCGQELVFTNMTGNMAWYHRCINPKGLEHFSIHSDGDIGYPNEPYCMNAEPMSDDKIVQESCK